MYKHLLVSTETKEYRHKTALSYSVSCNRLVIKLHKGKLATLELVDLVGEILRREPEARLSALQWNPLNQERGTYTHSGFSGCTDYYVVFKDDTTGYITRKRVFHETMSGYVETDQNNMISLFLPDFLLLGLNNELCITSEFFVNMLKGKLTDNIYVTDAGEENETTVEITEINQADKYSVNYVGSLSDYLSMIEDTSAEEAEEAGEVVGE